MHMHHETRRDIARIAKEIELLAYHLLTVPERENFDASGRKVLDDAKLGLETIGSQLRGFVFNTEPIPRKRHYSELTEDEAKRIYLLAHGQSDDTLPLLTATIYQDGVTVTLTELSETNQVCFEAQITISDAINGLLEMDSSLVRFGPDEKRYPSESVPIFIAAVSDYLDLIGIDTRSDQNRPAKPTE